MKKGVVMGLIVAVIGAEDNVTKAGVFCSMLWNIKSWILDLEGSLDKGLKDVGEDEEERLEVGSHRKDYNPCQFLYSLSTAKALLRFDSDSQVHPASE